jgi:hypothetical protein
MSESSSLPHVDQCEPELYTEYGTSCYGPCRCSYVTHAEQAYESYAKKYRKVYRVAIGLGLALFILLVTLIVSFIV